MSTDDQFYKNEDGIIGWIDQKIMLFARDVALFLRWSSGKENLEETVNYLWWILIIISLRTLFTNFEFSLLSIFCMIVSFYNIKRWPLFGYRFKMIGGGTRILIIDKFFNLVLFICSVFFTIKIPKTIPNEAKYFGLYLIAFIFILFYFSRVELPP